MTIIVGESCGHDHTEYLLRQSSMVATTPRIADDNRYRGKMWYRPHRVFAETVFCGRNHTASLLRSLLTFCSIVMTTTSSLDNFFNSCPNLLLFVSFFSFLQNTQI